MNDDTQRGSALVVTILVMGVSIGLSLLVLSVAITSGRTSGVDRQRATAVSAAEAEPYASQLLRLPRFVREGGTASWRDIVDGLALTGHFLMRDLLTDRSAVLGDARARLVERLRRAGGLD